MRFCLQAGYYSVFLHQENSVLDSYRHWQILLLMSVAITGSKIHAQSPLHEIIANSVKKNQARMSSYFAQYDVYRFLHGKHDPVKISSKQTSPYYSADLAVDKDLLFYRESVLPAKQQNQQKPTYEKMPNGTFRSLVIDYEPTIEFAKETHKAYYVSGMSSLQLYLESEKVPTSRFMISDLAAFQRGLESIDFFFSPQLKPKHLGQVAVDGKQCEKFGLIDTTNPNQSVCIYFSINDEYMPIQYELFKKDVCAYRRRVIDLRRSFNGFLYPTRVVCESPQSTIHDTMVYVVNQVREVKKEDFAKVNFAAGTQVSCPGEAYYKLSQDEAISVFDLAELYQLCEAKSKKTADQPFDPTIKHTGQKSSLWFWILGGLGLLLVGYGGYRWFRSRKRV
jgi:hypothetical protein